MRKRFRVFAAFMGLLSLAGSISAQNSAAAGEGPRHFILQYIINECNEEYEKTLNYFVDSVLRQEDQFILITPLKLYGYSQDKWAALSKQALKDELLGHLRKDAAIAGAEFQNVYAALEEIVGDLNSATMEEDRMNLLTRYRSLRTNLSALLKFNAPIYQKIAEFQKGQAGLKTMVVFLNQTFMPTGDKDAIDSLPDSESKRTMVELFRFPPARDINVSGIRSALAEAKVKMNLIYGKKKMPLRSGIEYVEIYMDFYQAFKQIAKTTGGTIEASFEPVQPLMKIAGLLIGPEKP